MGGDKIRVKAGKKANRKGKVAERQVVNMHKRAGFHAERTAPMQPGLRTDYPDVKVEFRDKDKTELLAEVKVDGRVPSLPTDMLNENIDVMFMHNVLEETGSQVLFMKVKFKGWVVCMRPKLYFLLLDAYKKLQEKGGSKQQQEFVKTATPKQQQ